MSARDRILNRLKQDVIASDTEVDLSVHLDKQFDTQAKLERFTEKLESVHGEIIRCSESDWTQALARVVEAEQIENLTLGLGALPDQAADAAPCEVRRYDADIEDWKGQLFSDVQAGFTTCRGGIAETGSLLLWPSIEEPRLLSLVPPIHIALLFAKDIANTFTEVLCTQNWQAGMPTNALMISGPSKSADIAQVLAYGVHGPKRLIVLLAE